MKKINNCKGFTLLEAVVSVAIIAMIILMISPLFKATHESWDKDTRLSSILQKGREAANRMIKELQEAPNIRLDAALSSTSLQYKVGDIFVDDGNSGYEQSGTWTTNTGVGQGGDNRTGGGGAGSATYRPQIIVPGNYEIYVFYSQAAVTTSYTIVCNEGTLTSDNVDQSTNNGKWVRLTDNAGATTQFDFSQGTSGYIQLSNTLNVSADAVKLVYKGASYKQFKLESAELKWGYNSGAENLYTLADYVDVSNSSFTYFKLDNTETADPQEVALIKIKLTLYDPQNKVPPFTLYGEAAVRNDNLRNVVINEIMYDPPQRTLTSYANWVWNFEPTTRYETDDGTAKNGAACVATASVTYPDGGNWLVRTNASDSPSGGSGRTCQNETAASTQRMVFTFTGTGVSAVFRAPADAGGLARWILQRDATNEIVSAGIINCDCVYFAALFGANCSENVTRYQIIYPIAHGLPSATYKLTVQQMNARLNPSGDEDPNIDAFDVTTDTEPSAGHWTEGGNTFYDNFEPGDSWGANSDIFPNVGTLRGISSTFSTSRTGTADAPWLLGTPEWNNGDNPGKNKPGGNKNTATVRQLEPNNTNMWITRLNGGYAKNAVELLISPTFVLGDNPHLYFRHWWQFQNTKDAGSVFISNDGGINWTQMFPTDWPRNNEAGDCGEAAGTTNGYPNKVDNTSTRIGEYTNVGGSRYAYTGSSSPLDDDVVDCTGDYPTIQRSWLHAHFDLTSQDSDLNNPPASVSYANSTVKIAFKFAADDQDEHGWAIDNFVMQGVNGATYKIEAEDDTTASGAAPAGILVTTGVLTYDATYLTLSTGDNLFSDGAGQDITALSVRNVNTAASKVATLKFVGTGIGITYCKGPVQGILQWQIDDGGWTSLDQYKAGSTVYQVTQMLSTGLSYGTHHLDIQTTNTRNASSGNNQIFIDSFDILRPPEYFRHFWEWGKSSSGTYFSIGPTGDNTAGSTTDYSYGTLMNRNYLDNIDKSLVSPTLNLSAVSTPVMLLFYYYSALEEVMDGTILEYSIDGGTTYTQVSEAAVTYDAMLPDGEGNPLAPSGTTPWAFSYNRSSWTSMNADLSTIAGQASAKIRFRFGSNNGMDGLYDTDGAAPVDDSDSVSGGFYIDDVSLVRGGGDNILEWIELYNLSIQDLDVNNWTIETITGSDTISNICSGCSADTTTIPSGGYAVIVDSDSWVYTDCPAGGIGYNCLIPAGAIKLSLSGGGASAFGGAGLVNQWDKIWLKNTSGNLIDFVGYNLVFYDDFESGWKNNWYVYGTAGRTQWELIEPTGAFGPSSDHTSTGTYCFHTGAGGGVDSNYVIRAGGCNNTGAAMLSSRAFNLQNLSSAYISWWQYLDVRKPKDNKAKDKRVYYDGGIVEVSTVGGLPSDTSGGWSGTTDSWIDGQWILTFATPAYTTVNDTWNAAGTPPLRSDYTWEGGGNSIYYFNCCTTATCTAKNSDEKMAFSKDRKFWHRETSNLSSYVNKIIRFRFFFGPNRTTANPGWYIDDVVLYGSWGGTEPDSLERRCPRGFSNNVVNWGASTDADDCTPGEVNSLTLTVGCQ